ncbi:helix-turn-helix domain-containing protein [Methylobacillus glycogenes]|uniref:helix-turn-helix domain-containing protein n=1 Tax=Methylobacillus glycogenes TaxID=406 RepID=UPI0004720465|nr:helix-turn-helix domain-containing protein [Methylobacillus glycogenes]
MGYRDEFTAAAPASLDLHIVNRSTSDVLEQADALPFWSQDYTQLSKGNFSGAVTSVTCQDLQIFTESMSKAVDQIASAPEDCYVVGLATQVEGDSTWGMLPVSTNSLISLKHNAELFFRTSNNSEITAAAIPAQRFEEYALEVEWLDLKNIFSGLKPVEALAQNVSAQLLIAMKEGMDFHLENKDAINFPTMWRSFEDDLMATCLHAITSTRGNTHSQYDHRIPRYLVNRVRECTLTNADMPLTIGELCTSLRVSRRTLNHAFIRVLGITPVTYMRNVRLHRVRHELASSPFDILSIAHVATKWGFWHLSLFSRYYRELFGECPTDTLQRSKTEHSLNLTY